jgi:endonuclease-3
MKAKRAAKKMVKKVAKEVATAVATAVARKTAKVIVRQGAKIVVKQVAKKALKAGGAPKLASPKGRAPKSASPKEPVLPHLRERWPRNEAQRKALATEEYRRLTKMYPNAHCALDHADAFQLLAATILSAQSTDKGVNLVTPELFKRYPNAKSLADAETEDIETVIKSTGFFRSKTKSLLGMARALVERHHGEVPDTMEELTELPGVGRKTANVVLGNAFNMNVGIVVDTHVTRLSNRLGLTRETDAVKIEQDLIPLFPMEQWTLVSHRLIDHGRQICIARRPLCEICKLNDICPSSRV